MIITPYKPRCPFPLPVPEVPSATRPHWQCSSAPSSLNRMYFFGHVKASNTFFGCPGNESSFSAYASQRAEIHNVLVLLLARLVAVAAATVD